MTIREAKQRVTLKRKIARAAEYVLMWILILTAVALVLYPVQYIAMKNYAEKIQQEKTHATILIGGEKITLEGVDVIHIEEE